MEQSGTMSNELTMSKYYFEGDFSKFASLFIDGPYATRRKRYRAGDIISSQGETLNNGYFIESGVMRLKIGSEIGKERALAFFGPGSVFPLGINEHHYRIEYAMVEDALTDIIAYQFVFQELRHMVEDIPELSFRMLEHYCDFTSYLFYELASSSYNNALVKVSNILSVLDLRMSRGNVLPLSQIQVAELAGISKVQVARAYRTLIEEGIIKTSRHGVTVVNRPGLERHCESEARL